MSGPVRIGVVGLGGAARSLVPSIVAHPDCELAAGCDPVVAARDRFGRMYGVPTFPEAEQLLTTGRVDAVYLATPHALHAPQAVLAAAYGKHVLVEKPMALTVAACTEMVEAAERAGVHLMVGHTHSFDLPVQAIARWVAEGRYGPLVMVNSWMYSDYLYRPRVPDELDTARGGGLVYNQLPHQVDMVRLIAGGLVETVHGSAHVVDPSRPTEATVIALLHLAGPATASVVCSGLDHFDTDELHEWVGEMGQPRPGTEHGEALRSLRHRTPADDQVMKRSRGYGGEGATGSASSTALQATTAPHHPHFGTMVVTCRDADLRPTPRGVTVYGEQGLEEVRLPVPPTPKTPVIDELVHAVRHGRPPVHDGVFGRGTMEVCVGILKSSRAGTPQALVWQRPVQWPDTGRPASPVRQEIS